MTPGIYESIPSDEYHSDPGDVPTFSASIAKVLAVKSPLHAWTEHPRLNPGFVREERELFDLGTVAHALMLQGIEAGAVLDFPDWKTKLAREAREAARAAGQVPILTKHWDRIKAMVESGKQQIAAHREASDAFTDGNAEITIVWEDQTSDGTAVMCRARIDWLKRDYRRIFDYKGTGTSINPETISKYAVSSGWDIQSALYLRGIKKLTGVDSEFIFIAQEDSPPYALAAIGMGSDFLWAGDAKVQAAMDTWAKCLASGVWSGYSDRIAYPTLPSYEETRITEKQLREA